jgi:hypothetical protein
MVTMYKGTKTKQVPEHDVKGQQKNGWTLGEGEVSAVLRPVKKNADVTPAVEDSSEQGDDDKANLKENENE